MATTMTNLALQLTTLDFTFRHVRIRRPRNPSKQRSHERFCWRCKNFCMNGCGGGVEPVEICSTRVLLSVSTLEEAVPQLHSAIAALDANPPAASSGVIRLEVPIRRREDALGWLREQKKATVMSRIFFSGREEERNLGDEGLERKIVSVAGVGSAVYFRGNDPFSFGDWKSIKRFLSKNNPFIRAYGAIRFDATRDISPEWKDFGSFYFIVPQVEFNELEKSSTLATNIIWDENLLNSWQKAIDRLKFTINQISPFCAMSQNDLPLATIISHNDIPNRISWDAVVEKALQIIWGKSYECVKVVLARRSRMVTNTDMDPLIVLARLSVESQNAYQFCIQPSDAFAFIGNTPEKLFHRKYLHVSSEALAGTRRRGVSKDEDLQIENDLLQSRKDDIEFTIVRESIRQKLEALCDEVIVKPNKIIRKLTRVQHLYAQLTSRLKSADDEFHILLSLHPTPAVCGLPTEEARQFIAETETFDRGMYAGPVGWLGGNESEFAVGIRSALMEKGNGTYIYAGVGVVEGTVSSLEWAELELKTSQFIKLFQQGK